MCRYYCSMGVIGEGNDPFNLDLVGLESLTEKMKLPGELKEPANLDIKEIFDTCLGPHESTYGMYTGSL